MNKTCSAIEGLCFQFAMPQHLLNSTFASYIILSSL